MKEIKPYTSKAGSKKAQVTTMFDNIAGNYDKLNMLITFGMDRKWRRNVLNMVKNHKPKNILDIATGTGDMLMLYPKTSAEEIVGVDISDGMLEVAREKISSASLGHKISVSLADAENLTFSDHTFDVVSITYGIRNFEDLNKGLSEILRVLNKGGQCVILETSVPSNFLWRQGYLIYTKWIMPIWGKLFSKDKKAYAYLSDSAINFPYGDALLKILSEVGFTQTKAIPQAGGISTIYQAYKPA